MDTFSRNGFVFEVTDSGPADGEAVVLLHGFPQDMSSWAEITPVLNAARYRTLAFNQRGYSPGARPSDRASYAWRETAADVIGLLDAAGIERAHVVGHDWGGAVAWCVASEWPERVISLAVLSTPHPGALRKVALSSTQVLKSWYMGLFQVPFLAEQLMSPGSPMFSALMKGIPEQQMRVYTERMGDRAALSAMLNWYRILPIEFTRPSIKARRISVPTMYIWGEKDPALGAAAAQATGDFVTGPYEFVILPKAGHWLPERHAEQVSENLLEHVRANPA